MKHKECHYDCRFVQDDIRRVAGNCGVVSSVIHAFDHFIDDEDVLQEACACVTNLSMDKRKLGSLS